MISSKNELIEWLLYEKEKYPNSSGLKYIFQINETSILRRHQKILRKVEFYYNTNCRLRYSIYKLYLNKLQNKYGLHIPINVCGKGLKIMHLGPILINSDAKIGENCSIHIFTSLVAGGRNSEAPIIGDNVVIGVGASIVGGINIADYTAIGANAVVVKNVLEENTAVAGNPAKKISDNGSRTWN